MNIDDDDTFNIGALRKINETLVENALDILMVDSNDVVYGKLNKRRKFVNNDSKIYSGKKFLESQQISCTPWHYIIRKAFLVDNDLKFCENVLYEDVDFCLKSIAMADTIAYIPYAAVNYSIREGQVSKVGMSVGRIDDMFLLAERLGILAQQFPDSRGEVIKAQSLFRYDVIVARYLWHLKRVDIINMLEKHRTNIEFNKSLTKFAFRHHKLYATISVIVSPFFEALIALRNKLQGRYWRY